MGISGNTHQTVVVYDVIFFGILYAKKMCNNDYFLPELMMI